MYTSIIGFLKHLDVYYTGLKATSQSIATIEPGEPQCLTFLLFYYSVGEQRTFKPRLSVIKQHQIVWFIVRFIYLTNNRQFKLMTVGFFCRYIWRLVIYGDYLSDRFRLVTYRHIAHSSASCTAMSSARFIRCSWVQLQGRCTS